MKNLAAECWFSGGASPSYSAPTQSTGTGGSRKPEEGIPDIPEIKYESDIKPEDLPF